MELGSLVAKTILTSAKFNKISGSFWNNVIKKLKVDTAGLFYNRLGLD
jgi:hypothetical protein